MINMNTAVMHDSPIAFPGLFGDWTFTASSKAIDIGGGVYWYGIIIALGVVLATLFCMRQKEKYGITEDNLFDCLLMGIPAGIIGARIYYVIFYLDLFRNADGSLNWGEVIAIWDGGLAIYGTVIGVLIVVFVYTRVKKISFFALTDLMMMGLLIGQAVGRWGNFMNREAFGAETDIFCRMQLTLRTGELIEVHPTFLYESLWNIVGLLIIVFFVQKYREFDGEVTWFYFLWYGFGRFWIEGLRTDSLYLFGWEIFGQPIRVSQAVSVVMVLVAAFMLFYNIKLHPHKKEELFVNVLAARKAAEEQAVEEAPAEEVNEEEQV